MQRTEQRHGLGARALNTRLGRHPLSSTRAPEDGRFFSTYSRITATVPHSGVLLCCEPYDARVSLFTYHIRVCSALLGRAEDVRERKEDIHRNMLLSSKALADRYEYRRK
ncbi:hypothetical protein FRC14_000129 [Serendipita sp. 396]|nr:hypothetical protein FRC14_000129 [Serendipita sp. 396]KAG8804181.1 hypothetical protein FRC16_000121 [Serendipita sp. 398]